MEFSQRKEKLTRYLESLISFQTLSCNQQENLRALKWVEAQTQKLAVQTKFYEFEGYPAQIITTQHTIRPKVWLAAHTDVVAASDLLFYPKIQEDRLYGRGAYDMKMAIACYLLLIHELKDALSDFNFGIMLTSDEEVGGLNGVRALLEKGYTSEVAFLPDGGFDWNFEEGAKGLLQIKIISRGVSAHASRPWSGINAINKLMAFLEEVHQEFEKNKKGTYYPTANLGLITGGNAINQVPNYAEAKIDIRFPPYLESAQIFDTLQKMAAKKDQIKVEKIIDAPPHKVDLNLHFFQDYRKIAEELHGISIGACFAHGASDARFFSEKNIPTLVIAPTGGDAHGETEWVDLCDLTRFYEVLKAWICRVAKI